ncbi:major capsid protein [Salibacterium halotolerans]|uniref:Phage major capsid protein E n=1 Tax=Salibacterium halotolerans TaxID=1884432 RepID=A0A1I5MN01_9BACI|nr:major capsid protein [Salibacterium halotolerans]SFP10929.1 Phage major capsid protein E [Salibacterium halotolerans]
MADQINIYDTRTMLAAVEQMIPTHTFLRDTFFPNSITFRSEHVDVDYFKGRRKMAPFVSPRKTGQVMDRSGYEAQSFKPPLIKPQRIITGEDLHHRSPGEQVYSRRSPQRRAAEMIARDIEDLDDAITRRVEWMIAQVLFTGKVNVKGDGVDAVLDFGFTNMETLSGTDKWDNYANTDGQYETDPMGYLKEKRREVTRKSGVSPNRVIMASDVVTTFVNHPKVRQTLDTRRVTLGQINPDLLPDGVTYIGSLSELGMDIYSYDEWYFDEDEGIEKPMVPDGTVMLGSSNARSSLLYGAVTLTDRNTNGFVTYESERVPDSWIQKDPPARILQMNSRPVPVPHEIDSWFVATVI